MLFNFRCFLSMPHYNLIKNPIKNKVTTDLNRL